MIVFGFGTEKYVYLIVVTSGIINCNFTFTLAIFFSQLKRGPNRLSSVARLSFFVHGLSMSALNDRQKFDTILMPRNCSKKWQNAIAYAYI